jgi:hypothetical protein
MIRATLRFGVGVLLSAVAASGASRRDAMVAADPEYLREMPAAAGSCSERPANHRLDFWLGNWIVYVGGALDGTSHIVSILAGCAVQEEWTDITGYQGRSWFYVDPGTQRLKQVWLTSRAEQFGGTKEKVELPGGGPRTVTFQGVLSNLGKRIIDRTTLTQELDDTVHQTIETSRDGGRSWTMAYDAVYRRSDTAATGMPSPDARRDPL